MDVVTHAMLGTLAGSPWLGSHPAASASFVLGSVAPDLDAFSRLFGKRAFLRWHQTWTHSLPLIALGTVLCSLPLAWTASEFLWLPAFFGLGMVFHALLDVTNTYGVTIWAPLSGRRVCLEWVFFIDATVIAACAGGVIALAGYLRRGLPAPHSIGFGTLSFVAAYWMLRAALHRRAWALAPQGTETLIPSALWPWRYLGTRRQEQQVELFQLDALNGRTTQQGCVPVFDEGFGSLLESIPEYRTMRGLSAAYHVVDVTTGSDETTLVCRDLRIRNFNAGFGQLDVRVQPDGTIADVDFHV